MTKNKPTKKKNRKRSKKEKPAGFIKKMDTFYSNNPNPTGGVEVCLRTKALLPKSAMKDIILTNKFYPWVGAQKLHS